MPRNALGFLLVVLAGCTSPVVPAPSLSSLPPGPASAASASAFCDIDLTNPIIIPPDPPARRQRRDATPPKRAYCLPDGSVVFAGRVTVDADGAPTAYNPSDTGLDRLRNGGHRGNWWALATDAPDCSPAGNPIVQQTGEPAPGFYVTKTKMIDPGVGNCRLQRRYVDSNTIPYVAFSSLVARVSDNQGRYAVVGRLNEGEVHPAIQADAAPRHGVGEASIELTRRLGLNPSPRNGGTQSRDFLYVVMPPHEVAGFPASASAVAAGAEAAYRRWGGEARLAACRRAVTSAPR